MIDDFRPIAPLPDEALASVASVLPADAIELLRGRGTGLFAEGFLRLIDPARYREAVATAVADGENAIPLFATAFADVIYWNGSAYEVARFRDGRRELVTARLDFLLRYFADPGETRRLFRDELYEQAVARHGVPGIDECFAFVPLLALGGGEHVEHLERVAMREHILLISQLVGPVAR